MKLKKFVFGIGYKANSSTRRANSDATTEQHLTFYVAKYNRHQLLQRVLTQCQQHRQETTVDSISKFGHTFLFSKKQNFPFVFEHSCECSSGHFSVCDIPSVYGMRGFEWQWVLHFLFTKQNTYERLELDTNHYRRKRVLLDLIYLLA